MPNFKEMPLTPPQEKRDEEVTKVEGGAQTIKRKRSEQQEKIGVPFEPTIVLGTQEIKKEYTKIEQEEHFLDNLTVDLKIATGKEISGAEIGNIVTDKDIDFAQKTRKLVEIFTPNLIEDIGMKERLFLKVRQMFNKKAGDEILRAFEELNLLSVQAEEREERRKRLSERIFIISEKYDTREFFDYLELGEEKGGTFSLEK